MMQKQMEEINKLAALRNMELIRINHKKAVILRIMQEDKNCFAKQLIKIK